MTTPIDLTIGQPIVDPGKTHRTGPDGRRRRQVAIFGAGVTGLTIAHELAERGFDVEVFEPTPPSAVEAALGAPCGLGGMARTQFARAETPNNRMDGTTVPTEPIWSEPPLLAPFTGTMPTQPQDVDAYARSRWALDGLEGFVVVGYRTASEAATADETRAEAIAARLRPVLRPPATGGTTTDAVVTVSDAGGAVGAVTVAFAAGSDVVTEGMAHALGVVGGLVRDAVLRTSGAPSGVAVEIATGATSSEPALLATRRAVAVREVVEDVVPPVDVRRGGEWTQAAASLRARVARHADTIRFRVGDAAIDATVGRRLDVLRDHHGATVPGRKRPVLLLRGFRAASEDEDIGGRRAATVAAHLAKGDVVSVRVEDGGVALADDAARPDDERRIVTIEVEEDWLPGEHGFRFFPSFYRHLFDSMGRIPLLEDTPLHDESPRSVIDNLVETSMQALYALDPDDPGDARVAAVPREPIASVTRLLDTLRDTLATTGTTLTDTARLMLRLFQYMTSSSARRAAEYEHRSWSDFIGPGAFSDAFARLLETAPLSLVGLRSHDADARTFGNVTVQLLVDQLLPRPRTDATMNAPTTLGWFLPWRRYLEAQGVVFRRAALTALVPTKVGVSRGGVTVEEQQLWAEIRTEPTEVDPGSPELLLRDYLVLALPATEAAAIVRAAGLTDWFDGRQLLAALDVANPAPPASGRHSVGYLGADLAHLSGVQFYFDADLRCIDGHALYLDAPWRLSAISQPQFWDQQRGWWDGYRGLLSVDVADWATPYTGGGANTAWDSTRADVAKLVWRQVAERVPAARRQALPQPIVFHLDENIVLDPATGRPTWNRTPLLLTRVGRYPERPGRLDPRGYAVYGVTDGPTLGLGRLVMAGTHLQTHTRLTTMEAANESARHAVNGILEAEGFRGARCRIWDIEDPDTLGLPDLRSLVDLDAELHRRGLPHLIEILDLDAVPSGLLAP